MTSPPSYLVAKEHIADLMRAAERARGPNRDRSTDSHHRGPRRVLGRRFIGARAPMRARPRPCVEEASR